MHNTSSRRRPSTLSSHDATLSSPSWNNNYIKIVLTLELEESSSVWQKYLLGYLRDISFPYKSIEGDMNKN